MQDCPYTEMSCTLTKFIPLTSCQQDIECRYLYMNQFQNIIHDCIAKLAYKNEESLTVPLNRK